MEIPQGLQLLQDTMPLKVLDKKVIKESANNNGHPTLKITGIFQRANTINANGRIYPREVLEEAVNRIQEDVKARRIMGEFDHPTDAKIHMDRVSHLLTNLWMEGDVCHGEAEVLDRLEPHGKNLRSLLEHGVQVGISSRGIGDMETEHLREGGEQYRVLPGYSIVTFDAVAEPSTPGSFLSVVSEGRMKKYIQMRKRREQEILEEIRKSLRP